MCACACMCDHTHLREQCDYLYTWCQDANSRFLSFYFYPFRNYFSPEIMKDMYNCLNLRKKEALSYKKYILCCSMNLWLLVSGVYNKCDSSRKLCSSFTHCYRAAKWNLNWHLLQKCWFHFLYFCNVKLLTIILAFLKSNLLRSKSS